MPPQAATPTFATVAYLRIPRFGTRPVAEQAALKQALESRVRAVVGRLEPGDFVVLDAEDGLAVVLFGDLARAFDHAQAMHAPSPDLAPQGGLNFGPLALTGRDASARVFGDGVAAAVAAAQFAPPGTLFATRDFARALEWSWPDRATELAPAGEYTDTGVRLHSFYRPEPAHAAAWRRRLAVKAVAGVVLILILGVVGREAKHRIFPPLPALVRLEVKPRGEVFVNGVSRGRSPPMKELEVQPGRHQLQIRNPGQPPLELTLDLDAGETITIRHTFGRTERRDGFWSNLRRKLPF